jgi:hypothetical protein
MYMNQWCSCIATQQQQLAHGSMAELALQQQQQLTPSRETTRSIV